MCTKISVMDEKVVHLNVINRKNLYIIHNTIITMNYDQTKQSFIKGYIFNDEWMNTTEVLPPT